MTGQLPPQIAAIQWNNKLKSAAMMLAFLLGIFVFAVVLVAMIAVPIALFVPDPNFRLDNLLENHRIQWQVLKFFLKVLIFCMGAAFWFIWKSISNVERVMSAQPLKLSSSDPFYRKLENLCISRGLRVPELYQFQHYAISPQLVTAAVMMGFGGKSALIVSQAARQLPEDLQEAMLAQAVQRLYTRDTHFLSYFTFLGYFPFHILNGTNKIGKIVFFLPLKAADKFMGLFRARLLDLRLARLDMGSLDLTKDAGPMAKLLERLPTHAEIEKYFYEPYLALFIARSAATYRQNLLAA